MHIGEIQGRLRQLMSRETTSTDERKALTYAVDALELMKRMAPGVEEAVRQRRVKSGTRGS